MRKINIVNVLVTAMLLLVLCAFTSASVMSVLDYIYIGESHVTLFGIFMISMGTVAMWGVYFGIILREVELPKLKQVWGYRTAMARGEQIRNGRHMQQYMRLEKMLGSKKDNHTTALFEWFFYSQYITFTDDYVVVGKRIEERKW